MEPEEQRSEKLKLCMYDKSLGFILAIIFAVGGLVLLITPLVAPEIMEKSAVVFLGGIFGLVVALFFALHVSYRRRCRSIGAKLK